MNDSNVNDLGPDFSGRPLGIELDHVAVIPEVGEVIIRPIRLDDEPSMIEFHKHVSYESVYKRYFEILDIEERTDHYRLTSVCTNTPLCYAVVVEFLDDHKKTHKILAVGRMVKMEAPFTAYFATLIRDDVKNERIARFLLNRIARLAHGFGFKAITSELLGFDNLTLTLCDELGFTREKPEGDIVIKVTFDLSSY